MAPLRARPRTVSLLGLATLLTLGAPAARAEESPRPSWPRPPEAIAKVLEREQPPSIHLSPTRMHALLGARVPLPPLSDLADPFLSLAGERVNPRTHGPHGPRRLAGFRLLSLADGAETRLETPADADLSSPVWNAKGTRFAFTRTTGSGIELWGGTVSPPSVRALTGPILNTSMDAGIRFLLDEERVVVLTVDPARGDEPKPPRVPSGPTVEETSGRKATIRTYQDLLQSAHDEALLEHHGRSRVTIVNLASGDVRPVGEAGLFVDVDPAPGGGLLLVVRAVRPFSRRVPISLFPMEVDLWDEEGRPLARVANVPLREEIPIQGVEAGPRGFEWRDDRPHTLLWKEALDGGDPKRKVPHRDRLLTADLSRLVTGSAPASASVTPLVEGGAGQELLRTEHRFMAFECLEGDGGSAGLARERYLWTEYDRDRRWTRTWLADREVAPAGPRPATDAPRILFDRSAQDRYGNPGTPLTRRNRFGRAVVRVHDGAIYLVGDGATPAGDRPFLDRRSLASGAVERLWRCEGSVLERPLDILANDAAAILTVHESPSNPPNLRRRDLRSGEARELTRFPDPAPELHAATKELLTYHRPDGVTLSATLYVPASRQEGQRLPLLVWAYPLEFNDARTAGQIQGSPFAYAPVSGLSHLLLLLEGYAVLDGATMPVIGDPETVNDTFVQQISAAAKAAIDAAAAKGVADPERCAVGGHSYGAFMTASLLAHTDLFRAGVARSGAYNRTLTPFGFQGERRTFWEASEVYVKLSPFTFAHRINEPLLLVHGEKDSNAGTFPIQSERLFAAMKGTGGTARLVMLPFEDHGYRSKEACFAVQAETCAWLAKWVRDAKGTPGAKSAPGERRGE